jgi:hypothetical protein
MGACVVSTATLPFDLQESDEEYGPVITMWRFGMRKNGWALLIYVNDPIADMCETGLSYDHEWDSPVTLHYAHRGRWD